MQSLFAWTSFDATSALITKYVPFECFTVF